MRPYGADDLSLRPQRREDAKTLGLVRRETALSTTGLGLNARVEKGNGGLSLL